MVKKYILSRITLLSAWIGAAIIFSALFLPTSVTVGLGLFLIITPDEKLLNWIPSVRKILEE